MLMKIIYLRNEGVALISRKILNDWRQCVCYERIQEGNKRDIERKPFNHSQLIIQFLRLGTVKLR